MILRLILVLIPIVLIVVGLWVMYSSSKEGSADVRGPGEAIGMMIAIAGVALGVAEFLIISIWRYLFS